MTAINWPIVPLGDVVRHRKEFITIDDLTRYKRCRVQLHAKGVVLRDEVEGSVIKTKNQQVCRAKEFLVAEIDAKVGGFGIVPDDLDGAIVSSHYFLFTPDPDKLLPEFLNYYSRTPTFRDQVAARGSTNYAAIRPGHVLGYTIPLPPLPEQLRIVAKIDRLAAKVGDVRVLFRDRYLALRALLSATRRCLIGDEPNSTWIPLHKVVVDIENGWSPQCLSHPAYNGNWGVLKVGAVSFGSFDPQENKQLPESLKPQPRYEIKVGDFLMSRANTVELVGACAIVRSTPPRLMLCDKIFRFRFGGQVSIDPAFLEHALKSPSLRKQIENGATGTSSTMRNISKAKILNLMLPALCIEQQRHIVSVLDQIQSQIYDLQRLLTQTNVELDAVVPSILDRAFAGEL